MSTRPGLALPVVEILDVPGRNEHRSDIVVEMEKRRQAGVRFVLPAATVIETGNHVFQVKDGAARRSCARRFMELLRLTAAGTAPWARIWTLESAMGTRAGTTG